MFYFVPSGKEEKIIIDDKVVEIGGGLVARELDDGFRCIIFSKNPGYNPSVEIKGIGKNKEVSKTLFVEGVVIFPSQTPVIIYRFNPGIPFSDEEIGTVFCETEQESTKEKE